MSKTPSDMAKQVVKDWFSAEGIKVETIKNPRAEFLFKVKFMRFFFTVVRPNDQKYIQIESQVMISPQHLKLLTAEKMKAFQINAMKYSFSSDVTMGFVQPRPGQQGGPKPPGPGFVVSDRIYDDAFSEDHLWRTMRKLHNAVNMVITILNETTGQPGAKPQTTTDTGPSYYT